MERTKLRNVILLNELGSKRVSFTAWPRESRVPTVGMSFELYPDGEDKKWERQSRVSKWPRAWHTTKPQLQSHGTYEIHLKN